MKRFARLLFILSNTALLVTGCGSNAKTLEPSFANYTKEDRVDTLDLFNQKVTQMDGELALDQIKYASTSYQIESSEITNVSQTYDYQKGKKVYKSYQKYNTARFYNHRNNVILYDVDSSTKVEKPGINNTTSYAINNAYQVYANNIIVADKNAKIYEVIKSVETDGSFSNYVQKDQAISNTYISDNVTENIVKLQAFVQEDYPLLYYVKKNLFTIGVTYSNFEIPVTNNYYKETLTVKSVCQISARKNYISVNVKYETTDIKEQFTDEYIELNDIDYTKETTLSSYSHVIHVTIGGNVIADTVDASKYSLGNVVENI